MIQNVFMRWYFPFHLHFLQRCQPCDIATVLDFRGQYCVPFIFIAVVVIDYDNKWQFLTLTELSAKYHWKYRYIIKGGQMKLFCIVSFWLLFHFSVKNGAV